ncbi:MAG: hypothetical protein ACXAC6_00720 [Candidatus Hodarchaeales archaeon]|jgi:hypothetical protein
MAFKDTAKSKRLILLLLEDMVEATTEELIQEAEILGVAECRDRVPPSIADLYDEGLLRRKLSKEKKAIVWSLAENIDVESLTSE